MFIGAGVGRLFRPCIGAAALARGGGLAGLSPRASPSAAGRCRPLPRPASPWLSSASPQRSCGWRWYRRRSSHGKSAERPLKAASARSICDRMAIALYLDDVTIAGVRQRRRQSGYGCDSGIAFLPIKWEKGSVSRRTAWGRPRHRSRPAPSISSAMFSSSASAPLDTPWMHRGRSDRNRPAQLASVAALPALGAAPDDCRAHSRRVAGRHGRHQRRPDHGRSRRRSRSRQCNRCAIPDWLTCCRSRDCISPLWQASCSSRSAGLSALCASGGAQLPDQEMGRHRRVRGHALLRAPRRRARAGGAFAHHDQHVSAWP